MNNQKTLFEGRVQSHHRNKTKSGAAVGGFQLALGGVVALAVGSIASWLIGGYWYFLLLAVVGAVLIVAGLAIAIFNLLRPLKSVICPACAHEQKVFRNTSNYVCLQCSEFLILGNDPAKNPGFSNCPYCGLKTAASTDVDPFPCPDCETLRRPDSDEVGTQKECSSCGSGVPADAMYCVSCGFIFKTDLHAWTGQEGNEDPVKDLEWRAGKSPRGHFIFANAILKTIDNALNQGSFRGSDYSPFTLLEESLISMEAAANDETVRKNFSTLFPELDRTYSKILNWELSVLNTVFSGSEDKELFSKIPIQETYIPPRERLEELFGDNLQSMGSIGKWNKNLVKWEQVKSPTGRSTSRYRIENYDKLKEETQRFSD